MVILRANGTLMARGPAGDLAASGAPVGIMCLTWAYVVERAKGIEPS